MLRIDMSTHKAFFAILLCFASFASSALLNPDFETFKENGKPEGWYVPSKFRVARVEASNGTAGLVYENPDKPEN